MRTRIIWLAAVLATGFLGGSLSHAQQPQNLIPNSGFEDGVLAPWGTYGSVTREVVTTCAGAAVAEPPVEGKYCLYLDVPAGAANFWDVGLQPSGEVLQKGKKYTVSAYMKSKRGELMVNMKTELGVDPWTAFAEQQMTITEKWAEYSVTTSVLPADVTPASFTFHIGAAVGGFWVDAVRYYEGDYVPPAFLKNFKARSPSPAVAATDVPREVVLGWDAGPFAATHDIYFGTTFADVNNATVANVVSKAQAGTTFDPAGALAYNTTYFWRIDEVNAAPDKTVFKGDTWSFTTEPYTYWIPIVTATASSSAPNMGPEKTVNGSGLANGLHSSVDVDMWLSAPATPLPAWIQYQFDRAYVLDSMTVWNSNQKVELYVGFGAKSATLEYSLDGTAWTALGDVEIARAIGADGYAGAVIDLGGILAKFVRLTITSTWGGFIPQTGLSEVRFSYLPVVARQPAPATAAKEVSLDATLSWRPGREAVSHKVFFSNDRKAVAEGTALAGTVDASSYQPSGLEYGMTYFWKVNEVNESATPSSWDGDIWSFTTTEYVAIDDFESYNDEEGKGTRIYETWIDGWTNNNGSTVGNWEPPFAEQGIVHSGNQSMPMDYNNINSPFYSEAVRTWSTPQDWTVSGATDLSLWFQGAPVGFAESASGAITLSAAGEDIYMGTDEFRFAYKQLSGNGSITVKVDSVQTVNAWTKAGVMIRSSLDPLAQQVHMISAAQQSLVEWMYRGVNYDTVTTQFNTAANSAPLPVWLRLTRAGNVFTGEYSTDGKTWSKITQADGTASSTTITMPNSVYVGMVVCSNVADSMAVAQFSGAQIAGSAAGSWKTADVGVAHPGNDTAPLYVIVEDSTGKKATVTNPDAGAVNATTWTEWRIPLADFAGVNMTKVKSLSIGVGDKSTRGHGKLYIDDIRFGRLAAAPPVALGNRMVNGGFEDGVLEPWYLYDNTGAGALAQVVSDDPIEGNSCLRVIVPAKGVNFWDVGLSQPGHVFEAGKKYTVSAWFKCATGTLDVNFKPELAADPWTGYGDKVITITNEWAEYSVTTPVLATDVSPVNITFHIGFAPGEFRLDGVRFYEGDYRAPDPAE